MRKNQNFPEIFECRPSQQGLAAFAERADQLRGFFLPYDGKAEDWVLPQPSLVLKLDRERVLELCHPERPACLTVYGPQSQDKPSNQDFALSAVIWDDRGKAWSFAAVADGVSSKTFWPERSSRIACLTAFEFFRDQIRSGALLQATEAEQLKAENQRIRSGLAARLRNELIRDHHHLLNFPEVFPATFAPVIYQEKSRDLGLWYNTTLLVALTGPEWGLLLWSGDGGIWCRKEKGGTAPETVQPLRSGAGLGIDTYVSANVQESDFKGAAIELRSWERVSILLASDGLDRTLQKQAKDYGAFVEKTPQRAAGGGAFASLVAGITGDAIVETDNWSIARVVWQGGRAPQKEEAEPEISLLRQGPTPEASSPNKESAPAAPALTALPAVAEIPRENSRPASRQNDRPRSPDFAARSGGMGKIDKLTTVIALVSVGLLLLIHFQRGQAEDRDPNDDERLGASPLLAAEAQAAAQTAAAASAPKPVEPPAGNGEMLKFMALGDRSQMDAELKVPDPHHLSYELFAELASWKLTIEKQASLGNDFSVVAFADRDSPSKKGNRKQHCEHNNDLAKKRSGQFAKLLLQMTHEKFAIHPVVALCQLPPGVGDFENVEARRLALYPGLYRPAPCDCAKDFPASEKGQWPR